MEQYNPPDLGMTVMRQLSHSGIEIHEAKMNSEYDTGHQYYHTSIYIWKSDNVPKFMRGMGDLVDNKKDLFAINEGYFKLVKRRPMVVEKGKTQLIPTEAIEIKVVEPNRPAV